MTDSQDDGLAVIAREPDDPSGYRKQAVRLANERDSWRRVAERLESEKVEAREQLRGAVGRERELREALETIAADADGIWRARFAHEELRRIYRNGGQ